MAHRHWRNCSIVSVISTTGNWRRLPVGGLAAPGGVLDPLVTGASLGDCIDRTAGDQIETGAIAYPILAAGFIGNLAEIEDLAFTLTWPGVRLCCRRGGVSIDAQQRAVEIETAGSFAAAIPSRTARF